MTQPPAPAPIIDTHCHLDPAYLPEGPDAVLDRAMRVGVRGFVVVGVGATPEAARAAVALARARPYVVASVGIHPHDASSADEAHAGEIERLAGDPRVATVGEVGLDYHYDRSPRATQREVFRRFIALARAQQKPLVIHTRSAPDDTLALLREGSAAEVGGVIHCFSEDRAFARAALDLGFDLSFSGIVTFKNARAVQDVAAWAPADRILVETDSPYLAPLPLRGKRCEPAFVVHTLAKVAELRGLSPADVARLTTENALRRFGPGLAPAAGPQAAPPDPAGGAAP
ncbi:MAG TPA: TatD family hydrolase [Polyangiaceae bacterium]|nr:TatD family hydrolase [Polyangiaceae bacterium]